MQNSILNPKVLVRCMTYNHEAYIEDALKGFVMQKTDFPFVVAVIDDASTDNNAQVIIDYLQRVCDADAINSSTEEYGKVIDAIPSDNSNCLLHVVFLNENHYGKKSKQPYYAQYEDNAKYIAMCEGDDYWTDPYKLQKQVDFLETHKGYSVCCHGYKIYNVASREQTEILHNEKGEEGFAFSNVENCENWYTKTLTILFRSDAYNTMPDMSRFRYWRDAHIVYYLLKKGKGYYLPFVGGTYREHCGGIYYSLSSYQKDFINFKVYGEIYLYNKDDQELVRFFSRMLNETMKYVVWRIRLQDYSPEVKENLSAVNGLLWKDKQSKTLVTWHKQIIIAAIKGSRWYQRIKSVLNPA